MTSSLPALTGADILSCVVLAQAYYRTVWNRWIESMVGDGAPVERARRRDRDRRRTLAGH